MHTPLQVAGPHRLARAAASATLALAAVLMLATVDARPAASAEPVTKTSVSSDITCQRTTSDGVIELTILTAREGTSISLTYSSAGEVVLQSPDGPAPDVAWSNDRVHGSVALISAAGEPAGTASVDLALASTAPPEVTTGRARTGNVVQHWELALQPLAASGYLELPTVGKVHLSGCHGSQRTLTVRTSQPTAYTAQTESMINLACAVQTSPGEVAYVNVETGGENWVSAFVGGEDFSFGVAGATPDVDVSHSSLHSDIPLWNISSGADEGVGTLDLTLSPSGRDRFVLRQASGRETFIIEPLVASGTLQTAGARPIALSCQGERTVSHQITTHNEQPADLGRSPVNDGPTDAAPLARGASDIVRTSAAKDQPEAPLWCYDEPVPDPRFETGRTVWYRFTGDGQPTTVDTAGSNFNTALAVYAVHEGQFTQVACADDQFRETWQAHATIDTDRGRDYLIQVGGVAQQSGTLHIRRS